MVRVSGGAACRVWCMVSSPEPAACYLRFFLPPPLPPLPPFFFPPPLLPLSPVAEAATVVAA